MGCFGSKYDIPTSNVDNPTITPEQKTTLSNVNTNMTQSQISLAMAINDYTPDTYRSHADIVTALRKQGVEDCNLIIGFDCTGSNAWTGEKSYAGQSLHATNPTNPLHNFYQRAFNAIGITLSGMDNDHLIPFYGFGDVASKDKTVLLMKPDGLPCRGIEEVLAVYTSTIPNINLSGPTSFAPIIRQAIRDVIHKKSYHILLIVADGAISSECIQPTIDAIVEASNYPLSIVMVGVGDGPWELMKDFDDNLKKYGRRFDNFQFVNFTEIEYGQYEDKSVAFACKALMEIPIQYSAIKKLGLL